VTGVRDRNLLIFKRSLAGLRPELEAVADAATTPGEVRTHAGSSRLAWWSTAILYALHDSRKREGAREISRHRHLIFMDDMHPDLNTLRRTCHSDKRVADRLSSP
jgi:hypothetical protein